MPKSIANIYLYFSDKTVLLGWGAENPNTSSAVEMFQPVVGEGFSSRRGWLDSSS